MDVVNIDNLDMETTDDYTAAIELSNACREFYRNRVEKTELFKQTIEKRNDSRHKVANKRTSIDDAMDKLRIEMASLMDQDLSLMKQLLSLNEAIEDLKNKRLYHVSKDSMCASSQEMHISDWSVSETDMFETDEESDIKNNINDKKSSISLPVPLTKEPKFNTRLDVTRRSEITIFINGGTVKGKHGQQRSIDSGYGDDNHRHTNNNIYRKPAEFSL